MLPYRELKAALCLAVLGLSCACGGTAAAPPAPKLATGLVYTDPQSVGWRLVQDASSTPALLVLNLVGPSGQKGRGVGFNLRSDGSVKFAKFASGAYLHDLGVFHLTNKHGAVSVVTGAAVTSDVGLSAGGVKDGGRLLTTGSFQKDRRWPAVDLGQPLYQVAIAFDDSKGLTAGAAIPLTLVRARSLPEAIGDNPDDPNANRGTWVYDYRIDEVLVSVGTLSAQ
jgi:hypothetical protein